MVALAAMGLWALAATAQLGAQQQAPRLDPEITFSLDGECRGIDRALRDADEADAAEGLVRWRGLARKAAALQQLDCTEDLVGATSRMVDEAERGDSLAMAALGVMCKRPPPTARLSLPLENNNGRTAELYARVRLSRYPRSAMRTQAQPHVGYALVLDR